MAKKSKVKIEEPVKVEVEKVEVEPVKVEKKTRKPREKKPVKAKRPMNAWAASVKEYNDTQRKDQQFLIPKKGTKEYDAVLKIYQKKKAA